MTEGPMRIVYFLPEGGREKDEERVEFETSQGHEQREKDLGRPREPSVVMGRAEEIEPGPDVIQRSHHRREGAGGGVAAMRPVSFRNSRRDVESLLLSLIIDLLLLVRIYLKK